jgi:ActR/RegA family two-component response regulator
MSILDESSAVAAQPGARAAERVTAHAKHDGTGSLMRRVSGAPRMIIVEDAPLIALDLAETMKDLGFDVRATAFTHAQALAEIQQSVPDYAVIDLHLGTSQDGHDGEALLSVLDSSGCRCLVFSGDHDACRRVAERYPQVSVLSKPAQPGALAREIERLRQLPF